MKKAHRPAARMTAVSDAMVLGVVLGLVFAAVSYYLYSMIGQLTRKVNVMENILLDLKVTTEQTLLNASELPELQRSSGGSLTSETHVQSESESTQETTPSPNEVESYRQIIAEATTETSPQRPSDQSEEVSFAQMAETRELSVEPQTTRTRGSPSTVQVEREKTPVSATPNYESMKYTELLTLAKSKGFNVSRATTTKTQVIELLRGSSPAQTETRQATGLESWTTSGVLSFDENGTELGQGGPTELSGPELTLVGSE